MFNDLICRLCGNGTETQEHLFRECILQHRDTLIFVFLFSVELENLKFTSEYLLDISCLF